MELIADINVNIRVGENSFRGFGVVVLYNKGYQVGYFAKPRQQTQ